jgi:hypothetical protein
MRDGKNHGCHTVDTKTYLGYSHCLVSSVCLLGAVGDLDSDRLYRPSFSATATPWQTLPLCIPTDMTRNPRHNTRSQTNRDWGRTLAHHRETPALTRPSPPIVAPPPASTTSPTSTPTAFSWASVAAGTPVMSGGSPSDTTLPTPAPTLPTDPPVPPSPDPTGVSLPSPPELSTALAITTTSPSDSIVDIHQDGGDIRVDGGDLSSTSVKDLIIVGDDVIGDIGDINIAPDIASNISPHGGIATGSLTDPTVFESPHPSSTSRAPSSSDGQLTGSNPLHFNSNEFKFLMTRISNHAHALKLKWALYDRRHEDYMDRFRAMDDALLDHTTILDTVVSKVSNLMSRMDQLDIRRDSHPDAIEVAFAAADNALQQGLQGLVLEVSDSLDRNIHHLGENVSIEGTPARHNRGAPSTFREGAIDRTTTVGTPSSSGDKPTSSSTTPSSTHNRGAPLTFREGAIDHTTTVGTPSSSGDRPTSSSTTPSSTHSPGDEFDLPRGRHPRFANVVDRWSHEDPYVSDAAYAASQTPHSQSSRSSTQISPDHVPFEDERPRGYNTPTSWDSGFVSPRHCESMLRGLEPHILAWHAGQTEGGDSIHGSPFMEANDVMELDPIDPAIAARIAEDHFQIVREWENPRWHQIDSKGFGSHHRFSAPSSSGPNVTEILKQIASWEKLSDLSPAGWLKFYNKLRRDALRWKIALMPFEAIGLTYEYQGHNLCICGLGVNRWRRMGDALFIILEYILPDSNAIIKTTITSLANGYTSANGYTLLWILLKNLSQCLTEPNQHTSHRGHSRMIFLSSDIWSSCIVTSPGIMVALSLKL